MTFAYFNEMENMFGHRQNINCNHVIGSSLFGNKRQLSSSVETDQQISTVIKKQASSSSTFTSLSTTESSPTKIRKRASLSTSKSLPTKISEIEYQQETSNTSSLSETSAEIPSSPKRKKSRAGSATYAAKTKIELEKQWLKHLQAVAEKNQKEDEKIKKIDEKLQLKKEEIRLKKKTLKVKKKILSELKHICYKNM